MSESKPEPGTIEESTEFSHGSLTGSAEVIDIEAVDGFKPPSMALNSADADSDD